MHDPSLDAGERATIINNLAQKLHDHYIFPEIAQQIDAVIRTHLNGGAYDDISGTNWEVTGVESDIAVPQEQALETAQILALRAVLEQVGDNPTGPFEGLANEARSELVELEAEEGARDEPDLA